MKRLCFRAVDFYSVIDQARSMFIILFCRRVWSIFYFDTEAKTKHSSSALRWRADRNSKGVTVLAVQIIYFTSCLRKMLQ